MSCKDVFKSVPHNMLKKMILTNSALIVKILSIQLNLFVRCCSQGNLKKTFPQLVKLISVTCVAL